MLMRRLISLMLPGFLLFDCDSYSNTTHLAAAQYSALHTGAATLSAENIQGIIRGVHLSITRVVGADQPLQDLPFNASLSATRFEAMVDTALDALAGWENYSLAAPNIVVKKSCRFTGTLTIDFPNAAEYADTMPENGKFSLHYENCRDGADKRAISGSYIYQYRAAKQREVSDARETSVTFNISNGHRARTGTVACADFGKNCRFFDDFSLAGTPYRIADASGEFNFATQRYTVRATAYVGKIGFVTLEAGGITVASPDNICSGAVTVTDTAGEVLTLTYLDCESLIVNFQGSSAMYKQ